LDVSGLQLSLSAHAICASGKVNRCVLVVDHPRHRDVYADVPHVKLGRDIPGKIVIAKKGDAIINRVTVTREFTFGKYR
jgi:hypothetical protein